ncbi:MAG TPA: DUF1080 domain-containing protein, partial [Candidatus Parabacteroides intestinavium]|nr:DUF1080 domain-containing protein [Candidatus Parabacteroides intestinavium]
MKNTHSAVKQIAFFVVAILFAACSSAPKGALELNNQTVSPDWFAQGNKLVIPGNEQVVQTKGKFKNFELEMQLRTTPQAKGYVAFHTDKDLKKGYKVAINNDVNSPIWWKMTGSLLSVRNLTKVFIPDNAWFDMRIRVAGKNIAVYINNEPVVEYAEPAAPYRIAPNEQTLLSEGILAFVNTSANPIEIRSLQVTALPDEAANEPFPLDEQKDPIIRLHQEDFPVLDYHVHLKGGLTKERAAQQSRQTGINYAIAPNCGIGFPVTKDEDIYNFIDSMHTQPFILAMQAEGREWLTTFSEDARKQFDYVFSDALTFHDNKNRRTRLWINDEVWIDDEQQYMDMIVEKSCGVIAEPIDIFVNPTFLPEQMNDRYDEFWTDARIQKFVDALVKHGKALEINELYRIPGKRIIMKAKEAGVKFTFGSNNVTPDVSDLSYSLQMKKECDLKPENM